MNAKDSKKAKKIFHAPKFQYFKLLAYKMEKPIF